MSTKENTKTIETKKVNKVPSMKEIINTTYQTALQCYGVVGVSRFDATVSGKYDPVPEEKASRGIFVRKVPNDMFDVDLYVVLSSEVKLTETIFECQKVVRYALNRAYNHTCRKVNVFVVSIK